MIITLLSMINLLHSQSWNIDVINTSNSQIPSNNASSLALDKKGQLWVGTTNGIGRFSNNLWTKLLVNNYIDEILNVWVTGDSIWIGTEYNGLWRFSNNTWTNYDPNTIGNGIIGFAIGRNDTIFRLDKFGSFDKWTGSSWTEIIWFVDHERFLFSDSKKNIWVGSGNIGLYKYNNGSLYQFKNNLIDTTAANYIPAYDLKCIVEDSDSNLWIGTGDKGLLKFNGDKWEIVPTPSNAKVLDIDIDKSNKLWLATDKGIMRYCNEEWLIFNASNSSLPNDRVVSILLENDNKIWAAVRYNDLYSPQGGKGIVCLTNELTGIKTNSLIDYRIYPNPTTSSITVDFNNTFINDTKVSITNLNGNLLYFYCINNTISTLGIDLNDYPKGIYLIKIHSDDIIINDKIIKVD